MRVLLFILCLTFIYGTYGSNAEDANSIKTVPNKELLQRSSVASDNNSTSVVPYEKSFLRGFFDDIISIITNPISAIFQPIIDFFWSIISSLLARVTEGIGRLLKASYPIVLRIVVQLIKVILPVLCRVSDVPVQLGVLPKEFGFLPKICNVGACVLRKNLI